jgi:hypothetical protein
VEADAGEPPCKALLWFTDGQFEIRDRLTTDDADRHGRVKDWAPEISLTAPGSGERAVEFGLRQRLCPPGGLADQLRAADVANIVVALSDRIDPSDEGVLRRIALGRGRGGRCGDLPAYGAYREGNDLIRLFDRFASDLGPDGGGPGEPPDPRPACPGTDCPEGRQSFTIDPGIGRFHPSRSQVAATSTSPCGRPRRPSHC